MCDRFYFAYGANISIDSMSRRCPDAEPVRRFFLRDWRLRLYNHATIEPAPGHHVAGALWRITPDCEASLDQFEGWPVYYRKVDLVQDGEEFMAYVMNDYQTGDPSTGYVQLLREGYQDWSLPLTWLDQSLQHCDHPGDENPTH